MSGGACYSNQAVMVFHRALHDGQTDPGPFKVVLGVEPVKHVKDLVSIVLIKADTIVSYRNTVISCSFNN